MTDEEREDMKVMKLREKYKLCKIAQEYNPKDYLDGYENGILDALVAVGRVDVIDHLMPLTTENGTIKPFL